MRHKYADVLIAIAEGRDVQYKHQKNTVWQDYVPTIHYFPLGVSIDNGVEWRVKPESKPDYCFYVGYDDRNTAGRLWIEMPISAWNYRIKITIDGKTNKPKSVELV